MLPLPEPPRSVCILRLSAIGDACHIVPIVRTLQQAWPATQLTWIIGRSEARLMRLLDGVEFITVDKRASLAGLTALRRELAGRRFEVLLHMQLALRSSRSASPSGCCAGTCGCRRRRRLTPPGWSRTANRPSSSAPARVIHCATGRPPVTPRSLSTPAVVIACA